MELVVNGKTVDLQRALPLTFGDWRALKKQGITASSLGEVFPDDPERGLIFLLYVLRKADQTITETDVDTLSNAKIAQIAKAITASEQQVNKEDLPL